MYKPGSRSQLSHAQINYHIVITSQFREWTVETLIVDFLGSHMLHYACHDRYSSQSTEFPAKRTLNWLGADFIKTGRHVALLRGPTVHLQYIEASGNRQSTYSRHKETSLLLGNLHAPAKNTGLGIPRGRAEIRASKFVCQILFMSAPFALLFALFNGQRQSYRQQHS